MDFVPPDTKKGVPTKCFMLLVFFFTTEKGASPKRHPRKIVFFLLAFFFTAKKAHKHFVEKKKARSFLYLSTGLCFIMSFLLFLLG